MPAVLALLLTASLVSGCGALFGKNKEVDETTVAPNVIYGKADTLLDKQAYADAAKAYEDVDINHPYSQEARKAIVMSAYAYYKAGKYNEAVGAADRYLTLHPGTPESDLAQNIIGMSYYDQVLDPKRDQTNARKSLQAYLTLLQRYPEFPLRRRRAEPRPHPARPACRERDDRRPLIISATPIISPPSTASAWW